MVRCEQERTISLSAVSLVLFPCWLESYQKETEGYGVGLRRSAQHEEKRYDGGGGRRIDKAKNL